MDTTDTEEALRQMEREIETDDALTAGHKVRLLNAVGKVGTALQMAEDEWDAIVEEYEAAQEADND